MYSECVTHASLSLCLSRKQSRRNCMNRARVSAREFHVHRAARARSMAAKKPRLCAPAAFFFTVTCACNDSARFKHALRNT